MNNDKRPYPFWVIILVFAIAATAMAQEWEPPRVIYIDGPTCRAFIQSAREPGCEHDFFRYWTLGYISGRNDSLPNGGNVLGAMDANADDFLARVRTYCTKHPDHDFFQAITKTLNPITPVDAKGAPYGHHP